MVLKHQPLKSYLSPNPKCKFSVDNCQGLLKCTGENSQHTQNFNLRFFCLRVLEDALQKLNQLRVYWLEITEFFQKIETIINSSVGKSL